MSASRTFKVSIDNNTQENLNFITASLDHGEWTEGMNPPAVIPANSPVAVFQAESDGFLTGCAGTVYYGSTSGRWTMTFGNPYDGDNSFIASAATGFPAPTWAGANGWASSNDPTGTVTFAPAP